MAVARGASDAAGQMVLCTGTGPVTVYMDETGAPTQAPHFCPDCTTGDLAALMVDPPVTPSAVVGASIVPLMFIAAKTTDVMAAYLSRAPPVLI